MERAGGGGRESERGRGRGREGEGEALVRSAPATGHVTGDAPAANYRSRDSMTSEVEFQRQLALGSSASNSEFHGDDPENDQIRAATRLSLGGHRRGDAARKKDEVSGKTQSRQYWEYDVIDYDEKVVDGFYDAYGISTDSRLQGEMPSLTDLQTDPGSSSGFEAVVVNRKFDHALEELIQIAHCIGLDSPDTEVTDLVQRLAELVTGHMGSPVADANVMWARWMKRSTELRTSLQTNVVPIGSINVGLSRHRALLFKVLADSINLPCRLLKGRHYTGHAANLIKLDDERVFLVDLMASPGCKLPSLRSPNDLGVVHPMPKPLAGKGSSQSSNVDRSSSSKTSESFPAFPFASHDPGVGSSRVSSGTAQQLTVNVVWQSKKSSEDPTNLFADLNPFAIKGFPKVPMEGSSTEIKINEMPRQKNNPVPDRPPVRLMPKNRHPHNEVPRKKDYGLKEGLFPRGNREASAYNVSSSIGSSTTDRVSPDRISVRKGQQLNIIVVPRSKNGSEDPTNHLADLNPAPIKGFRKAPTDGECTEIKINERLRQKNNPVVPLMPKNRDPLNEVSRTNDCGFKDRLFPRSNWEPDAYDVSSFIGSSMTDKVNPDSFKLSNNLNRSTQVSSGIKLPNKSNQLIKKGSHWNPFMDNNPILGCSTGQSDMMPHAERLNFQVREDPLRTPENLQDGIADSQRGRDGHEIGLLDPKKCTNDKFMDKVLDDVDVGEEIQWEHLVIVERIGLGSSGEVYHAYWNGTEVAVKKFLNQDFSGAALNEFRQEVRIMHGLHHPNIVRFMGAVARPPHLSIITEFVPRGSLYRIIHRPYCQISEKLRINMALGVVRGMNCLHTRVPTIVHRDLKSPNLLVDINWNVKVCDFGLSRLKHNTFLSSKSAGGTPQWMAPEVLCNEPSNEKCDVYSFGVILWELATLRLPWTGMDPMQVVGAVGFQNRRLDIPEEVHPLVRKIILECWQTEPNLRPSFAELTVFIKSLQRLVIPSHLDRPNSHLAGDQPNSSLSLENQLFFDLTMYTADTVFPILGNKLQFSWPDILDTMRSLASEKDRVTLGFQLLCVIMNDWISTLPAEFLPVFIDVIGAYSAQKTDLNISLTAIGFLWTAADIIARGLSHKPSKEKEREAGRGDVQYIPWSVDGEESLDETCVASGRENDEACSKSTEDHDKLLFSVFMLLQRLGADERPEVRNSAVRTLFQTLGSHGQKPSKSMWEDCLRNYVFPMLNQASLMAATSSKDKWRGKELGTRGEKVVHMFTHHSCNTAQKQLDETLVLVLNGIYRILRSFFPFLKRLSNFWSGWEYLLIIVKDGILNGSKEVALAAVRSLQTTIVSHSRKGNLPMPYLTSVLEVYEFVFQRSPSNGINSTRKAKQKILHGLGKLYVQAPSMFDSQMYTQLLAIIDLAIKQSMTGSENVETDIGNIRIQRTVLEILPLLRPTENFSSLWLILLREILRYLPQPDESLQNEEEEVKRTNAPDGSQDVRAKTRIETPNGIASTSLSKAELDSHSSKTKPMCISSNGIQEKVIPLLVDLSLQTPTVEKHIILPEIVESLGRCVTSRRDNPDAGLWRTAVEGFNRIVLDDVSRLKMNSGPDASISGEARARFWKEVADVYEAFLVGCCGRALPTDYLPAAAVKADESLEMTVLNILGDNVLRSPIDASADILQRLVSTLDRCASRTFTLPIDTVEPMPLHSSRFSLTCLEKLFSLTSYDSEACNGSSITSDISKISIMVLMARCEYILNRFLIDENDLGERPLPAARLEEMIYVLQQLASLVIHKETVFELPLHPHLRRGLGSDDGHNRRAHLLVLFPSFCELVASRESRVRELVQVLLRLIAKELALGKFQALTGLK